MIKKQTIGMSILDFYYQKGFFISDNNYAARAHSSV
jgi:hypothetical protein